MKVPLSSIRLESRLAMAIPVEGRALNVGKKNRDLSVPVS